jgi:hypothetical protein
VGELRHPPEASSSLLFPSELWDKINSDLSQVIGDLARIATTPTCHRMDGSWETGFDGREWMGLCRDQVKILGDLTLSVNRVEGRIRNIAEMRNAQHIEVMVMLEQIRSLLCRPSEVVPVRQPSPPAPARERRPGKARVCGTGLKF